MTETGRLEERHESLWWLTASPAIWAAHFLLCYVTAAVWCGRLAPPGGPLGAARTAIGAYTAVALAGIALVAWHGLRRHRYGGDAPPHDFDTPEDRHRFLGYATLLLSGMSLVATIYVGMVAVFFETCR